MPINISGSNITLWRQLVAGGNINISGDQYGNTEISGGSWPVSVVGAGTNITLETDLVLDSSNNYFIFGQENANTFTGEHPNSGDKHTIDISGVTDGWSGLFKINYDLANPTIKYLGITSPHNSILYSHPADPLGSGGWLGHDRMSGTITNCYTTGDINANNAGGIVGSQSSYDRHYSCNIIDCYSIGDITGEGAGGITGNAPGRGVGVPAGECNVTNCYSTGNIIGEGAGGITGRWVANGSSGNCNITNCYSLGDIIGSKCGGVTGELTAYQAGTCDISNCYSTGDISGSQAGGIAGYGTSASGGGGGGTCNITNCYSIGDISGSQAGGITGNETAAGSGTVNFTNCYVLGATSGTDAFTLYGADVCGGTINTSNCTPQTSTQTTQSWSDTSANALLTGYLDDTIWKKVSPVDASAEPWKLRAFLNDTTSTRIGNTITYTNNTFPIMPYKNTDTSFNFSLMKK